MRIWQLQEAKARLSEVIKEAVVHGPQEITLRGEPAVVILSMEEYKKLTKAKPTFIKFMQQSPLTEVKISLKRDKSLTRETKL